MSFWLPWLSTKLQLSMLAFAGLSPLPNVQSSLVDLCLDMLISICLFSLRNLTRIVLQGIGSQKIGSLAFRDSWAFVHHFKTSIDYNFEEVIFLLLRRMIRSSLCFVWFEKNEWAEQTPHFPVIRRRTTDRALAVCICDRSFSLFVYLDSVSTVKISFSILAVQLFKIWNTGTSGYSSVKRVSKASAPTKRFVYRIEFSGVCCTNNWPPFKLLLWWLTSSFCPPISTSPTGILSIPLDNII